MKGVGLQDERCRFTGMKGVGLQDEGKECRENPILSAFREGKNRFF